MGERPAKSREGWGLFITNLPEEVEEDDVDEAFRPFGTLTSLHVPLDRMTGNAKGYCMLEYPSHEEALAALSAMNGKQLKGKAIEVAWLCKQAEDGKASREVTRSRSPHKS
ncbi:unnamed protein product [Effrenium voratum]|nr:unnamed protein product [Effrenium voratum]